MKKIILIYVLILTTLFTVNASFYDCRYDTGDGGIKKIISVGNNYVDPTTANEDCKKIVEKNNLSAKHIRYILSCGPNGITTREGLTISCDCKDGYRTEENRLGCYPLAEEIKEKSNYWCDDVNNDRFKLLIDEKFSELDLEITADKASGLFKDEIERCQKYRKDYLCKSDFYLYQVFETTKKIDKSKLKPDVKAAFKNKCKKVYRKQVLNLDFIDKVDVYFSHKNFLNLYSYYYMDSFIDDSFSVVLKQNISDKFECKENYGDDYESELINKLISVNFDYTEDNGYSNCFKLYLDSTLSICDEALLTPDQMAEIENASSLIKMKMPQETPLRGDVDAYFSYVISRDKFNKKCAFDRVYNSNGYSACLKNRYIDNNGNCVLCNDRIIERKVENGWYKICPSDVIADENEEEYKEDKPGFFESIFSGIRNIFNTVDSSQKPCNPRSAKVNSALCHGYSNTVHGFKFCERNGNKICTHNPVSQS